MNKLTMMLFITFTFILQGCVQTPVNKPIQNSQLAVSSVWDIPTTFSKGSNFKLMPIHAKHSSLTATQTEHAYRLYEVAISKNLHNYGYQQVANDRAPDFIVGFGIALAEDVDDNLLNDKFGITPGLQESKDLDKGSFLIYVENASNGQRVWRGAIQGFIQEGIDSKKRAERIDYSMQMVLAQFHKAH
jgi:hypothetical protein